MTTVRVGFIPVIDCAVVVVAHERGFAERRGIRLVLHREGCWAAIRDKLAFGLLDAAHILAPLPLALALGLNGELRANLVAPFSLGRGGNAITVSLPLYREMCDADPAAMTGPRATSARALAPLLATGRRLRLATVHQFSPHTYELRHWLAAGGLPVAPAAPGSESDAAVTWQVVPPPRMVEHLDAGLIDGFCVGEPWNQMAAAAGLGALVAAKVDLTPEAPEKVLAFRRCWAETHPDLARSLLAALGEAAVWADAHRAELAELLARPEYLAIDQSLLLPPLCGRPLAGAGREPLAIPAYQHFVDANDATAGTARAAWVVEQMQCWGQLASEATAQAFKTAADIYAPLTG